MFDQTTWLQHHLVINFAPSIQLSQYLVLEHPSESRLRLIILLDSKILPDTELCS
jgi:hypothetical protein